MGLILQLHWGGKYVNSRLQYQTLALKKQHPHFCVKWILWYYHICLNWTFSNFFFLHSLQINIDFQTKNLIAQNIQEANHTCFSAAQKRVYSLMENNSYPRFLESEFYQELCKKPLITKEPQGTWTLKEGEEENSASGVNEEKST